MKKLLTFLTTICTATVLQAQAPVIQFQKTFGGTQTELGGSIRATSDGGYIIAGRTTSNDIDVSGNHGGLDWWIVKTDVVGTIQWQKTLGGTADDIPYRVIQTSDGGYAIAGWTESSNGDVTGYQGNKDCWVVKLNSTGGLVWQKSLGGTSEEEFRYIIETADGGLACVGWSLSNDGDVSGLHGFRDTWLVKLSSGGVIQWQKMLGGLNDERGYTVVQTTDLGYMVSSVSSSTSGDVTANNGLLDYWIAKTDNLGNIQWQKNYGGSGIESNRGTIQTSDGGYLINGYTESSDIDITNFQGVQDVWLVKIDNLGVMQWQKTFGGNATDRSGFVTQTADGGYLFSGNTNSTTGDVSFFQGGASDYWLVKISSTGTIEWEKTMGGTGGDFGGSVVLLNNGYLMMGSTDSNNGDVTGNKGSSDLWMVKLLNSCAPGSVTATLSGDASICSGGSTNLTINFTGAAPWFYTVDGGPSQTTFTSPVTIPVSPVTNTTYNVTSVSDNVCPTGTTAGSATVLVSTAIPINSAKILSAPVSSCQNNVSLIVAKVITGQNILYRWTGPTGTLFSNAPGGPFVAGPFSTTVNQVYTQTGTLPSGISGYSICVQGYNGCGQTNTNCTWMRATVSTPNAIVGDNAACPLETKTYSVNIPTGSEVFNWSFSVPGATIIPANLAGNIVNVTFPAFTTGTLCVTAGLTCGASSFSNSRCITITSTPSRPGLITGASTACGGTTQSYSIAPVSGANNYTWSFPAAGALIDGTPSPYITTATSVTVSFPAGYNQNRELCVTANNSCSSSLIRCKTIGNQVPEKPTAINPSPATWCNNSIITLSVSPVAGATSYNWTLSNGTINSGQGTASINATWGVGSGNIYVTASNACGTSSERLLNGTTNCRIAGQAATTPFNIYPNPATDYLTIEFESTKGTYSSKLMNMNGQILISSSGISTDGSNSTKIDLTSIAPGVYILEFTDALSSSKTLITIL